MSKKELKKIIDTEGFIITSFNGISMLPLLDTTKDLVKIVKINRPLKVDDMVVYCVDDRVVLHRIINIKEDYYEICGDNLKIVEKVAKDNIFGVVDGYFKNGREVKLDDPEYLNYLDHLERDISKREQVYKLEKVDNNYIDFLNIVLDVINNKESKNLNINFYEIYKISKRQKLTAFIFKAINKNKCPIDIYKKFEEEYNIAIQRKILFDNEKKEVLKLLEKEHLKYLPFKGEDINNLYPKGTIREFADVDMLVDDQDKVKEIMLNRGYKYSYGFVHNIYSKDIYNFEIHKSLIFEEIDKTGFFNNPFSLATKDKDNEYGYHLDGEIYYVYLLMHTYKHYISGGIGLRYYLDLYYYRKNKNLNNEVLESYLDKLDLLSFNNKIVSFIEELINGDISKIDIDEINYMLEGSIYGLLKHRVDRDINEMGKFNYILHRVFISTKVLTRLYPSMRNRKVLYPVYFAKRIVDIFTTKSRRKSLRKTSSIVFKKKS